MCSSDLLDVDKVKTWDRTQPRDAALLVPIDVRALVVPQDGTVEGVTLMPTPGPSDDPWPRVPQPFAAGAARAPGVYLHFAMPDSLARAPRRVPGDTPGALGNPMSLPALPNRFLVVRMVYGRTATRAWVIEADEARRTALSAWAEGQPGGPAHIDPATLTATRGGDVAWAACYDAVVDRFGMHDDLADLDAETRRSGRVSYLVVGWWSVASLDPLAGTVTLEIFRKRLEARGWSVPADTVPPAYGDDPVPMLETPPAAPPMPTMGRFGNVEVTVGPDPARFGIGDVAGYQAKRTWPGRTLVHGVVHGAVLDGSGLDLRPEPSSVELALGGHSFGALSALLAEGVGEERRSSERLLLAFTAGKLASVDGPDGVVAVDEERHARCFTSLPGGTRTVPDRVATGDPLPPRRSAADSNPVPGHIRVEASDVPFDSSPGNEIGRAHV